MAQTRITHPSVINDQGLGTGLSVFLMAPPGGWKTSWICQWPGVCVISFANEQGDHAITTYPQVAKWYLDNAKTRDVPPVFNWEKPQHFIVRTVEQMENVIDSLCQNHKKWGVSTVGIDLIQFYISIWQREYFLLKYKDKKWANRANEAGGEAMDQQAWGMLNVHIDGMRVQLANAGLNSVWTSHCKEIWKADDPNRPNIQSLKAIIPAIQGGTRLTIAATTSLHIYGEITKVLRPGSMGRYMNVPTYWVAPDSLVDLRHKYFDKFPTGKLEDPDFGTLPTFRALWNQVGSYIYMCR